MAEYAMTNYRVVQYIGINNVPVMQHNIRAIEKWVIE